MPRHQLPYIPYLIAPLPTYIFAKQAHTCKDRIHALRESHSRHPPISFFLSPRSCPSHSRSVCCDCFKLRVLPCLLLSRLFGPLDTCMCGDVLSRLQQLTTSPARQPCATPSPCPTSAPRWARGSTGMSAAHACSTHVHVAPQAHGSPRAYAHVHPLNMSLFPCRGGCCLPSVSAGGHVGKLIERSIVHTYVRLILHREGGEKEGQRRTQ